MDTHDPEGTIKLYPPNQYRDVWMAFRWEPYTWATGNTALEALQAFVKATEEQL